MPIVKVTLKGLVRDRVLQGVFMTSLVFLVIPTISTLSMRQVSELALTLCLSSASLILLVLAVFLGGVSLWRDIERRFTISVLTLPFSRTRYLLGRFFGITLFLLSTAVLLSLLTMASVSVVTAHYPAERPLSWFTVIAAIGFDSFKCIFLVAFAFLFSAVSTSFFLPIFGTIGVYLIGGASQQVHDYVNSPAGQSLSPVVRQVAELLYFVVPNFSAFDLKANAIYSLPMDMGALALTAGYGTLYTAFVLITAAAIFSIRELG